MSALDLQNPDLSISFNTSTSKSTNAFEEQERRDINYNSRIAKLLRAKDYGREAGRVAMCGEVVTQQLCANGHWSPKRRSMCDFPSLCPRCARIEREVRIEEIWAAAKKIQSKPVIGHSWRSLVLTVATNGDFLKAYETGQAAWRKLWRNRLKLPNVACVRSAEFGPINGNFHFHVLYYGPYVDQGELADVWEDLTGGSRVVWVQSAENGEGGVEDAVREVVKYITKFETKDGSGVNYPDPERLVELWEALRAGGTRPRLFERLGLFRQDCLDRWVGKDDEVEEEPSAPCDCPECGAAIVRVALSDDLEPRPPPSAEKLRVIHNRARERIKREDAAVEGHMLEAFQAGIEPDLEKAKRAVCVVRGYGKRQGWAGWRVCED